MPGGDGTGPRGFGPGTGRAAGYCGGYVMPGYANPVPRCRGWRGAYYPQPWQYEGYAANEKMVLEQQVALLREQLKQLEARLGDISETGDRE